MTEMRATKLVTVLRRKSYVERLRILAYRSLSSLVLRQTHLKIDWINTGHHKNLDTIGKQNYQELGVKAELNFEFFEFYAFQKRYGHRSSPLSPITSTMLRYAML